MGDGSNLQVIDVPGGGDCAGDGSNLQVIDVPGGGDGAGDGSNLQVIDVPGGGDGAGDGSNLQVIDVPGGGDGVVSDVELKKGMGALDAVQGADAIVFQRQEVEVGKAVEDTPVQAAQLVPVHAEACQTEQLDTPGNRGAGSACHSL